jgi:hypothetical protein
LKLLQCTFFGSSAGIPAAKNRHFIAATRDGAFNFHLDPEWNVAWRARQDSNL